MTREEETRQNIEKYHNEYIVTKQESMILREIAISLAIIADVLKKTHFVDTEQGTDLEEYLESTIMDAPTIIEADKGESEEV